MAFFRFTLQWRAERVVSETEKADMKRRQEGQIAQDIETVFRLREYRPDVVGKVIRIVYLYVEGEVELEVWNEDLY